ncbi:RloB domain-containing protein [Campylobacter sp. RM9337]|uniref:RloB domain-containing protein n=1 Tax=Campylobacter californiensis TaxID=1032243 RepID=A0AAW3ZT19_9BACT|nr:RloB family protein [Campylobacter sp. RM9337]MBE3608464.1 RloB domain-containing protein [Campylobacter sp. RM9337]
MGTDDLYKKRKARKIKKSGDLMVIICEGQKSEPNYISEFIKDFKSNRNLNKIKILPNHYTDPLNIVQQAVELKKDGYDIVACVFDKDTHANFSNAIELARKKI